MNVLVLLFGLLLLHNGVHGARILGVFPVGAPSHYILGNSLLKGLAEKGHDVTMVSPFAEKNPPKNGSYRDIVLSGFAEEHERSLKEMNLFEMEKKNFFTVLPFFTTMMIEACERTLNHTNVQKLIHSDEKFDVVIVQFLNEAQQALATHFNAPLILFSTIGTSSWINQAVGNPQPLAYVPETLIGFSYKMTFSQRLVNVLAYVVKLGMYHFYMFPQQDKLIKKYFPNVPNDIYDVMYNTSIVLLNSHPSIHQPVPYVPSMIDVGGLHLKPPKKLPKDLQEFLDNAKDGVIYFSLGSNLKSTLLPKEKREILLNTFSKLKEKVLWKWEEDILPGKPPNVHIAKWLPQQDVLAHPNLKLFITHGGLLSTTEIIYHGVPALAIPIGGDQKLNAQQIVNQGIGLTINFQEITEEALIKKINQLLTNPKYLKNAKSRSDFFHDRLVSPLDTAIYWVEYVIRHRGAPHLRVAALDLSWYQYFLLDVIVVVSAVTSLVTYVLYQIVKKICSICCKPQKQKLKSN
jgi:hypothetical protein